MHTKHDLGGTSSPMANIRGSDLRPSFFDVIALDTTSREAGVKLGLLRGFGSFESPFARGIPKTSKVGQSGSMATTGPPRPVI